MRDGLHEVEVGKAGIGQNRTRIRLHKQTRSKAQQQIAMGDTAGKEGVGLRRFLVHVAVECIAREMGKAFNVLQCHFAGRSIKPLSQH